MSAYVGDPWGDNFNVDRDYMKANKGPRPPRNDTRAPDDATNEAKDEYEGYTEDAGREAWLYAKYIKNGEKFTDDLEYTQHKRRMSAADRYRREELERNLSGTLTASQEALSTAYDTKLLKRGALRDIPKPVAIVEGLLFLDSLSWIAGESGSYKSFVALDIVGHYAGEQTEYHGLEVASGKALMVVGEGGSGFNQRVEAWEEFNGCEWSDDADFFDGAINLGDKDPLAAICHIMKREGHKLVVFDTQAMMTVGMDENNAQDMGRFVAALHALREATGACILVVHHFGKSTGNMRGSGSMYAAATTVITTDRGASGQVTLSTLHSDNGKQKDATECKYPPLVMQTVAGSLVVTAPVPLGGEQTAPVVVDIDERKYTRTILALLKDMTVWGGTNSELKKWLEEKTNSKLGSNTVSQELQKMVKEGLLSGTKGALKVAPLGRRMLEG